MKKLALTLLAGTALLVGSLPAQASDEAPRRRAVGYDKAPAYRVAVVGDELRPERVPAGANFVLYFDVENFKRTSLWKLVQANQAELDVDDDLEELDEFRREFGIDPLTDVKSVLVYGTKGDDEPSAIQIVVNDKVDQAIAALRQREGYKALSHEGYLIHSFGDGGGDRVHAYVQELRGGDRVIVLSEDIESVHESALVLNGEAKSLSGSGSGLQLAPRPGSFLHVAATDISDLDDFAPASQVFGLAQGIQLDFGEAGGSLFANLTLTTESPDTAMDVAGVVQGLMAMARLALMGQDEIPAEARQLLNALQVNTRGNAVSIDFEFSTAALLQLMQSVEEGVGSW